MAPRTTRIFADERGFPRVACTPRNINGNADIGGLTTTYFLTMINVMSMIFQT
jgi:hypothetical protein